MADPHAKMTQATPQEVIISLLAGLFAPLLAIFLIVQLVLGIQEEQQPDTTSEAAQKATLARIKPFAQLVALDANAPRVEKAGQEVYDAVCSSCHSSGALGAPRFDNKGEWSGRLGQGYDTLVKHAIEGIRQMPPRGGDGDLSDVEVARAVVYMANSAGASFKEPAVAAPAEPAAAPAAPAAPVATPDAAAAPAAGVENK
jgi:cytochrome c5